MADPVLFEFLHTEMVAELWAPDPDPGSGVSGTPWPRGDFSVEEWGAIGLPGRSLPRRCEMTRGNGSVRGLVSPW